MLHYSKPMQSIWENQSTQEGFQRGCRSGGRFWPAVKRWHGNPGYWQWHFWVNQAVRRHEHRETRTYRKNTDMDRMRQPPKDSAWTMAKSNAAIAQICSASPLLLHIIIIKVMLVADIDMIWRFQVAQCVLVVAQGKQPNKSARNSGDIECQLRSWMELA